MEVIELKNNIPFTSEERETIITTDDSLDEWDICTRQGKIMTKLKRIGVEPYKVLKDVKVDRVVEAYYKVAYSQISFRKLIQLTEEQLERRREVAINNMKNRNRDDEDLDENDDEQLEN